MKHIAILKLWALGDIVMSTPMLSAIKATHSDCEITWIINKPWAPVLEGHPLIDHVFALDTDAWRRKWREAKFGTWIQETRAMRKQFRDAGFDAVINCHPEKWWTRPLCVAPRQIGLFPGPIPGWANRAYTDVLRRVANSHDTDHYLLATRALGIPDAGKELTLGQTPDEEPFFRAFMAQHAPGHTGPVAVVAPFSTAENKCWSGEQIAQACDRLREEFGTLVIMTMGPKDGDKARAIAAQAKHPIVLAEGTTLRQYIALLRYADFAVTMDSSALHLCAAIGTPYITLWGPTPEWKLAPLVARGINLRKPLHCAPCDKPFCVNPIFRECMNLITVDEVGAAARETLNAPSPNPSPALQERGAA